MVTRESIFYASLRQACLLSPVYASRLSSRTVLFMSVPHSYHTKAKIQRMFGKTVNRIWITTDCKKLEKLEKERNKLCYRLEEEETKLVKAANAARLKAGKLQLSDQEAAVVGSSSAVEVGGGESDPNACPWMAGVKRPKHRLRYFGKKVDTIDWLRSELERRILEVDELQHQHRTGEAKTIPAVFVEFRTQTDAQIAYQTLSHHQPFYMTPRYIGIAPQQIIWSSLRYNWWERIIRKFMMQGFIAALIIFWSIPSALVGTISNVGYLSQLIPFLKFINELPSIIQSVISGLLPSAALAMLMSIVPIILRCKFYFVLVFFSPSPQNNAWLNVGLYSLRKAKRTSFHGKGRAIHPKRTLCLPGRSGVLSYDHNVSCIGCNHTDHKGPAFS